jgi:hypothetical protein
VLARAKRLERDGPKWSVDVSSDLRNRDPKHYSLELEAQ